MELSTEERFKTTCLELIEMIYSEVSSEIIKEKSKKIYVYISGLDSSFIIRKYIDNTKNLWDVILKTDVESIFKSSDSKSVILIFEKNIEAIFIKFPPETIDLFKREIENIFDRDGSFLIDIWAFMTALIKICKNYIRGLLN